MNNNETAYVPRWAASRLHAILAEARVTVLTGARQVGKSTLMAHELGPEWATFTLDDLDIQAQVQRDPDVLLQASRYVALDEAHCVPALFSAVKRIVDHDRSRRFILSGSANLLLMSRTTESLAGRAEFVHLLPLSWGELNRHPVPGWLEQALEGQPINEQSGGGAEQVVAELGQRVWRGGMPEGLYRPDAASLVRWREGYIRSYLERDLRQLSQIENLPDFKRLMSLAALRSGRVLNQSELARDAGLSQPTAHRYLGLLEVSEQCRRLPAYRSSAATSIVKSPKLMWTDTGIGAHCAGLNSVDDLMASREWGAMLETHIGHQLRAVCELWDPPGELYFWRTRAGEEVDFVIRRGRHLLAFEVKAGGRVRFEDTAGLQAFMRSHPACAAGVLLYGGASFQVLAKHLYAVPLGWLQ